LFKTTQLFGTVEIETDHALHCYFSLAIILLIFIIILGECDWSSGFVSGAVYHHDTKTYDLVRQVYGLASYTNPLHPDVFPGVCKMEAEVVRMACNLFNGDSNTCGTVSFPSIFTYILNKLIC
jgi:hypothetical protein